MPKKSEEVSAICKKQDVNEVKNILVHEVNHSPVHEIQAKKAKIEEKIEKIQKIYYDTDTSKKNRRKISVKFSIKQTKKFYNQHIFDIKDNTVQGRQFLAALKDSNQLAESEFQRHLTKKDFEKARCDIFTKYLI